MLLSLLLPYVPPGQHLDAETVRRIEGHLLLADLPAEQFVPRDYSPPAVAAGPDVARARELVQERAALRDALARGGLSYYEAAKRQTRIREINKELSGNADQKERANWLRARARGQKGELVLDTLTAALGGLGWSVEEQADADLVHINGSNTGLLEDLFRQAKKGTYYSIYPDYDDATRWAFPADVGALIETEVVAAPVGKAKKIEVAHPVQDVLYTSIPPTAGLWGSSPILWTQHTAVGVRAWVVTAPNGDTFHIQRWPRVDTLRPGDGFWKWAYAHGLREQAQEALPDAEAAIAAPALLIVHPRGYNACSVCFGSHALTNAQRIMDHGYRRPLWGYNVDPCPGRGYHPYPDACTGTQAYLADLLARAGSLYTYGVRLDQRDPTLEFSVMVTLMKGDTPIPETNPARKALYGPHKVQQETVTFGDPRWGALVDRTQRSVLTELGTLWQAIPFYRAAVRCWFLGATYRDILPIPADTVGRPTDLLGDA